VLGLGFQRLAWTSRRVKALGTERVRNMPGRASGGALGSRGLGERTEKTAEAGRRLPALSARESVLLEIWSVKSVSGGVRAENSMKRPSWNWGRRR